MTRSVLRASLLTSMVVGSAAALAAQTGTVQGKVADSTGAVISGVTITVDHTSLRVTSNADGRYILRNVPSGPQTVRARIIRFSAATLKVTVPENDAVELNITLKHTITQLAQVDVVVGSHAQHTAADELAVPVDIYSVATVAEQGSTETGEIFSTMSPSIGFPVQSVTDANDIMRPFTLRGLSPDHTVVLINGWRRHETALMNNYPYGSAPGSSGVDLNAIPASAIGQVEVLRDGAASQYGSDAIAGVVNIKLREGEFDPFLNATAGQYNTGNGYQVDGQAVDLNGGIGLEVGRGGSLGIFGEYGHHDPTNRAWADPTLAPIGGVPDSVNPNTGQVVQKRNGIPQPNYHWGDGLEDDGMLFVNFRAPVGGQGDEIYAFSGYSRRVGTGNGYFRYPGDVKNWTEIYPNGFLPQFHPTVQDFSLTGGYRTMVGGWTADLGASYGANSFNYHLDNTLNASLGPSLTVATGPTAQGLPNQMSFDAGTVKRDQFQAGLTLSKSVSMGLKEPVSVTLGALFRDEGYQIVAGEKASWIDGGHLAQDSGTVPGDLAPPGSSVFPGFAPTDASNNHRTNIGVFGDLESNLSRSVLLNVAGRFENYSDFGSNLSGKLAARWQPEPQVVVRASVSSGFRAPGVTQAYFSHAITNVIGGTFVDVGIYPTSNQASVLFGAQPLKNESSVNFGAGVAYTPVSNFTMTLDGFYISITNQIMLGATYTGAFVDSVLTANSITGIGGVQYFSNGIDTRTSGLDFTSNLVETAGRGTWNFNLAVNFTKNTITRVGPLPAILTDNPGSTSLTSNLDPTSEVSITKERPDWRGILTGTYTQGRFHGLGRISYFGIFSSMQPGYTTEETYPSRTTIDAEVGYQFSNVDLTIGSRNLFNIYPGQAHEVYNNNFGVWPWAAASPFGYNGRYFYIRANMILLR